MGSPQPSLQAAVGGEGVLVVDLWSSVGKSLS